MKMKKRSVILVGASMLGAVATAPANAGCSYGETGYLYVSASCTQERRSNPKNVCQTRKDKTPKNVFFVSNVIADNGGNSRYPTSGFFDAMKIQHDITQNGSESFCYRTRVEAEDDRNKTIADRKRGEYIIRRVEMRDY